VCVCVCVCVYVLDLLFEGVGVVQRGRLCLVYGRCGTWKVATLL
jgi:hypothetical protein